MENQNASAVEVVDYNGFTYNELKAIAKFRKYDGESQSKESLIEFMTNLDEVEAEKIVETETKLGRKIDPTSDRQKRLAEKEQGGKKRGRPVDPTSPSNIRKADIESRRASGELKAGRPAIGVGNGTSHKHTNASIASNLQKTNSKVDQLIELLKSDPTTALERYAEIAATAAVEAVEEGQVPVQI